MKTHKEYAEKVNAMADEELRVRAADLDGFHSDDGMPLAEWLGGRTAAYRDCGLLSVLVALPDYLNDWAAAGRLFDALVDGGFEPTMESYNRKEDSVRMYQVEIASDSSEGLRYPSTGYLDSPCRAITKAFILAMEAND